MTKRNFTGLPSLDSALFLKSINNTYSETSMSEEEQYPMFVPIIRNLKQFRFEQPITIFSGANGCGKTTLLEIIAAKIGANRIGEATSTNTVYQIASRHFDLKMLKRSKRNFFFSGEDFIKYIEWVEQTKQESRQAIRDIDTEYGDTYAAMLAKQPHQRTLYDLANMYAQNLSERSHGEGFIDFFKARLIEGGLYLLDEPESALTYENQYLLAMLIREAAKKGCQFIISTHSPVITAIPEADLYEIVDGKLCQTVYESLENIQFLQMFFRKRSYLFEEGEAL